MIRGLKMARPRKQFNLITEKRRTLTENLSLKLITDY
jgi:hypothetical protein